MAKNNRLRILNILGGAKEGGAEKFLREFRCLWRKIIMLIKK